MVLKLAIKIVFCLLIFNTSFSQSKIEKIDKLLNTYFEYGTFNGTALVTEKGKIIYKKAFGKANMEWDVPNTLDTKFRLASVSKQFTAMAIMQLVAENKLQLDVPISKYLPDYPAKNGDRITTHNLLTHTSGTPNYTASTDYMEIMRRPHSPGELVKLFADLPLEFKPGEKFSYSNSGYVLLGHIIEKITGKKYEQVLNEKIFTPLKMINSGYDLNDPLIKNRASGYYQSLNSYVNAGYLDMSVPFSAGALYSTVEDMAIWDQALYTEKLLPKKYLNEVFKKQTPDNGPGYGYGWMIGSMPLGSGKERVETISHGGNINGFNTIIVRIPKDKSSIILLNNTGDVPLNDMSIAILGILYDQPYNPPQKSMANSILAVLDKEGSDSAISFYRDNKNSKEYSMQENEINTAGYQLLQSGKNKEAATVFKINTEKYPNSFNAYDSYGEALLALKDSSAAIENYKRSVILNPGNEGGIKVLKSLGINTEELIVKVPREHLKQLAGEYVSTGENKNWKIIIEESEGQLYGNDGGYKYKLNPNGNDKFTNPDDGAVVEFDTKDMNNLSLILFEKFEFKKVKK